MKRERQVQRRSEREDRTAGWPELIFWALTYSTRSSLLSSFHVLIFYLHLVLTHYPPATVHDFFYLISFHSVAGTLEVMKHLSANVSSLTADGLFQRIHLVSSLE